MSKCQSHKEAMVCAECHAVRVDKLVTEWDAALLQNCEWDKLVRVTADVLYALGKAERARGMKWAEELMVIGTNLHRQCQIIKGEEPLPAPGERLTDKQEGCKCVKPCGSGETCTLVYGHHGPCQYVEKQKSEDGVNWNESCGA